MLFFVLLVVVSAQFDSNDGGYKSEDLRINPRCFRGCPDSSPCFNSWTGNCQAKFCDSPAHCRCAGNTRDVSQLSIHSSVPLWIGFATLFIPGALFLVGGSLGRTRARALSLRSEAFLAGGICLLSALCYLAMALDTGHVRRCDGRQVFWVRHLEWLLTTPLILYQICAFAGTSWSLTMVVIAVDFVMILSGVVASSIGGLKWVYWLFSMFCFLPIMWVLGTTPYMYVPVRDRPTHGHLISKNVRTGGGVLSSSRQKIATHDGSGLEGELDHPMLLNSTSSSPEAAVVSQWGISIADLMNKVQSTSDKVNNVFDDIDNVLNIVPKAWRPFGIIDKVEDIVDKVDHFFDNLVDEILKVLHIALGSIESLESYLDIWETMPKIIKKRVRKKIKRLLNKVIEAFKLKLKEWEALLKQKVQVWKQELFEQITVWWAELKEKGQNFFERIETILFTKIKDFIIEKIKEFLKEFILPWIKKVLIQLLINVLQFIINLILRPHGVVVENRTYTMVVRVTMVTWCCYPLVWIFGDGVGFFSVQAEMVLYLVLDLISKVAVGALIYYTDVFETEDAEEEE